jgi:hypothetical protein
MFLDNVLMLIEPVWSPIFVLEESHSLFVSLFVEVKIDCALKSTLYRFNNSNVIVSR